ncbi:unnamed protein product [Linum tenue]|uniref:Alpha-galactosidase n=1 Tax=Linum tenue TaxID=586396 RepID=A0AAV0HY49_9ROSI|nr:unnamed protein product [Linum tenue]
MKKMVGNGGQHDVGMKEKVCGWVPEGFMSVNTSLGAGKAFLKSIHHQYIEWGVDFIKHDCVFGSDLSVDEITIVSQMMKEADHPITYSLSPGTSATPSMAKQVSGLANMYRITTDDWDSWRDVASHLNITRNFADAEMIGGSGLLGKSWPDLDMLPLGWLTDLGKLAFDYIASRLTLDEQRTQMTPWSMAKSPLMFGGEVRKLDENATFDIITNPTLLEINHFSSNNSEVSRHVSLFVFAVTETRPISTHSSICRFILLVATKPEHGSRAEEQIWIQI